MAKEETTLTQQRTRAARRFAWLWRHFGHPGPKDQGTGGTGRTTNGKRNRPNKRESHRSKNPGHAIPLFFIHHFFLTTSQQSFVMLRAFPSPLFHLQVRGRYFATNYFQKRQQRANTRTWPGCDAKNKYLFFSLGNLVRGIEYEAKRIEAPLVAGALLWNTFWTEAWTQFSHKWWTHFSHNSRTHFSPQSRTHFEIQK